MKTKTIRVSEETYRKLVELKADFMNTQGTEFSFDQVLSDALDYGLEPHPGK